MRLIRIDDDLQLVDPRDQPRWDRDPLGPMTYVGFGGRTRTIQTDFYLGRGVFRVERHRGLRRAIWDAAYGYVSGFRKRDIAYYLVTRSLSFRVFVAVLKWERRRARERGDL
jgi:hypothetical protein